ncbi:MAG: ferredoxin [Candidatus Micrarchaeota archaeon]
MPKYTIELDRDGCIGAAVCEAVCPKHWKMADDGKVDLADSVKGDKGEFYTKEVDEADFESMKMAADGCPVKVIHITNKDTGEKLI